MGVSTVLYTVSEYNIIVRLQTNDQTRVNKHMRSSHDKKIHDQNTSTILHTISYELTITRSDSHELVNTRSVTD